MSGFHEVQFPTRISYGSGGGPAFNTNIINLDSGVEERVPRWSQARCRFNVANGVKTQNDLHALITFYRARLGSAYGFRYKDWSDYATTEDGATAYGNTVSATDCQVGVGDGATTQFQLYKVYTSGSSAHARRITKPVAGTVTVALAGVLQSTGWSVNTTSGVVTFSVAPALGVAVTAGFEFDVPVRFEQDTDQPLSVRLDDYKTGSAEVNLVEVLDGGENEDEFPYGGAQEEALTGAFTLSGTARLWVLAATAPQDVLLPDSAGTPTGGPIFFVVNDGSATLTLKDAGGTTVAGIAAGAGVAVCLAINALGQRVWYAF